MWTIIDGPKVKKVTRSLVDQFVTMPGCPNDRPFKQRLLDLHTKSVATGVMRSPEWASTFCEETNTEYRVNGKHTSFVFSKLDPLPDLCVFITKYSCPTLTDVAELYATFDNKISLRSSNDIYRAFCNHNPELSALSDKRRSVIAGGYSLHLVPEGGSSTTAEKRAEVFLNHPEFCIWAASIVEGKDSAFLHRGAVVGSMFRMWLKSHAACREFWKLVKSGETPLVSAADRVLQRYLLSASVNNGNGPATGKKVVGSREMMARCIIAWNAWRKGEQTILKYHAASKMPAAA